MIYVIRAVNPCRREMQMLSAAFLRHDIDVSQYEILPSIDDLPDTGDIVMVGGPTRYKTNTVYEGDTYRGKKYDRRILRLPIIGKSVDDDLSKALQLLRKGTEMAARVFSGETLEFDLDYGVLPAADMVRLLAKVPAAEILDFDFETTGLDPRLDEIVTIGVAWSGGALVTRKHDVQAVFEWLAHTTHPLRVCNAVFEQQWFITKLNTEANIVYDVQVDHCLLCEEESHALDVIASDEGMAGYDDSMFKWVHIDKHAHHEADEELLCSYNVRDAEATRRSGNTLHRRLVEDERRGGDPYAVHDWMIRGQRMLARLRHRGMYVDPATAFDTMQSYTTQYSEKETTVMDAARSYGLEDFNFGSFPQKSKLLYECMKLRSPARTKSGAPAVNSEALDALWLQSHDPVVGAMRDMGSIKTTIDGILTRCIQAVNDGDGFMRSNLSLTKLVTGQLSSTNPPMQNVANNEIRRIYRSRFKGGYFGELDYSQLHLRIIGNLAQCEGFIGAYENGIDLHARTAARVIEQVEEQEFLDRLASGEKQAEESRSLAKRTNFSIIFEISARALAAKLGVTESEAKRYIERFFIQYPEIKDQIERQHSFAVKNGYVISPMGRVRHLPRAQSADWSERGRALRQSGDYLVSNTGRSICLYGMIMLDEELIRRKMQSMVVMQVHDSVELDIHPKEVDDVLELAQSCMVDRVMQETAEWMDPIPLVVDGFVGESWYKKDAIWKVELT